MKILTKLAFLLLTVPAWGTTYYVGANGNDSNNGTAETTPFLHAPGMPNCSNTCASTTINPGDSIILRGGDTWHANVNTAIYMGGNWNFNTNGSSGQNIVIGVDKTWYTGATWTRPIITGDNPPANGTSYPSSCAYDYGTPSVLTLIKLGTYNTFDNIEWTGDCWSGTLAGGNPGMVRAPGNDTITNFYCHGWTMTSGSVDTMGCISSAGAGGNVIEYGVFDGDDAVNFPAGNANCTTSPNTPCGTGIGIYAAAQTVAFNVFHHIRVGGVLVDSEFVHDNTFEYMDTSPNTTISNGQHDDAIMYNKGGTSATGVTEYLYNNVVRHNRISQMFYIPVSGGQTAYVFNNVFYDNQESTVSNCIQFNAQSSGTQTLYLYNNTFDQDTDVPNTTSGTYQLYSGCEIGMFGTTGGNSFGIPWTGPIYAANNHMIGPAFFTLSSLFVSRSSGTSFPITDNGGEVIQVTTIARGQNYVQVTNDAPTQIVGSTVNTGIVANSLCSTFSSDSALCNGTTLGVQMVAGSGGFIAVSPGIPTISRGAAWNSGAYEANLAPQIYLSRTDNCELGSESNCPSHQPLAFLGCNYWGGGTWNAGALAWSSSTTYALNATASSGSTVYRSLSNGNLNNALSNAAFWQNLGACGTVPSVGTATGFGTQIIQPDMGVPTVRATDVNTYSVCGGASYQIGSAATQAAWAADASKFVLYTTGGTPCIEAFNATEPMVPTYTSIGGNSAGCSTGSGQTQFCPGSQVTWSHQNPNMMWEVAVSTSPAEATLFQDVIYAVSGTGAPAPNTANAANWAFTRTKVFNFLTDCGGCLPSDFYPNYSSIPSPSNDDTHWTIVLGDDGQTYPYYGITAATETGIGPTYTVTVTSPANPPLGSVMQQINMTPSGFNGNVTVTSTTSTQYQYKTTNGSLGTATGFGLTANTTNTCPLGTPDPVTGGGKYGPIFMADWTLGTTATVAKGLAVGAVGYRIANMCQGTIAGNWGDLTTTGFTSGVGQAVGTSGGGSIPDLFSLHAGHATPNPLYTDVGPTAGQLQSGSCGGVICPNSNYYWEVATTNLRPCSLTDCGGHGIIGFVNEYDGSLYTAHSWGNPSLPNQAILTTSLPTDDHGFGFQLDSNDDQPIGSGMDNPCGYLGTVGGPPSDPCPALYTVSPYQEVLMTENSVTSSSNKHCLGNTAACQYRQAQNYSTGTNWNFQPRISLANSDNSGRWALLATDWNRTLGCTNSWDGVSPGQLCLDPVSAANAATSATFSNIAVDGAGTTATVTAVNSFSAGMYLTMPQPLNASFLNGNSYFVTASTGGTFTICVVANSAGTLGGGTLPCTVGGIGHASYSGGESSGTTTWPGCGGKLLVTGCARSDVFIVDMGMQSTPSTTAPTALTITFF